MGAYVTPYDIGNRACQMLGFPRFASFTDGTRQGAEAGFLYDKARRAELRRLTWTFATRRAVIRPVTDTTVNLVFPAWASGTTYNNGDIVTSGNMLYSAVSTGSGNTPGVGGVTPQWEVYYGPQQADTYAGGTQYFPGDIVVSAGTEYRLVSRAASTGVAPPSGVWVAPAGLTTSTLVFPGPYGYESPAGANRRNYYRLPANFLRLCAQDPKQASVTHPGTSAGLGFTDWEIEQGYLVSSATSGALILRFVADVQIVVNMEDMFCEAVACRLALGLNEILTQRPDLAGEVANEYGRLIAEARSISAIEGANTEGDIGSPAPAPAQGRGR